MLAHFLVMTQEMFGNLAPRDEGGFLSPYIFSNIKDMVELTVINTKNLNNKIFLLSNKFSNNFTGLRFHRSDILFIGLKSTRPNNLKI